MTKQEYMEIYNLVGAAMEVYNTLGRGMAEPIYQEAIEKELELRNMKAEREKMLVAYYKGEPLKKVYYADFYYKGIVVELKSVDEITPEHRAQLFNYMRITKQHRGLLLNFGEESLHAERYLYLPQDDRFVLLNQDNIRDYISE